MPWIPGACTPALLSLVLHALTPAPATVTSLSGRVLDQGRPVASAVVTLEPIDVPGAFPELVAPETDTDRRPPLRDAPAGRVFVAEDDTLLPRVLVAEPGEQIGVYARPGAVTQSLALLPGATHLGLLEG